MEYEDKANLTKSVENLAKAEAKQASAWWAFIRGMMYGLGFFIGSALLATIVIYVLSKLQSWGSIGNFIHEIIQNSGKSKS